MDCDPEDYPDNLNLTDLLGDNFLDGNFTLSLSRPRDEEEFRHVLNNIIIPVILCFGLVGNLASLVIFSQKRLRHVFDEIEQSATIGLVALAISDFCFCLTGFPAAFLNERATRNSSTLALPGFYYRTYHNAFFNMFMFTSTWITVLVSMERYVAVCHPFRAQNWVRVRRTVITCSVVFLISIVISVPHFLAVNIIKFPCANNCSTTCYAAQISQELGGSTFDDIYRISWVLLGTLLPFILLVFCNVSLIAAIQRSKTRGIVDPERYSTSRITLVLVVIICLYVVLVCPSMALTVITDHVIKKTNTQQYYGYHIAIHITNFTQAVNFSINFLLYFAMCKQFRAMITVRMCGRPIACKHSKNKQKRYLPVNRPGALV